MYYTKQDTVLLKHLHIHTYWTPQ